MSSQFSRFTATGSMVQARAEFLGLRCSPTARCLWLGVALLDDANGCLAVTNKVEIYDPTGTWKATGSLRGARHAMTAMLLTCCAVW